MGNTFPERLRQARNYYGLTQEEAAKASGIPLISYKRYELGYISPNLIAFFKISKGLNIPPEWLIGEAPDNESGSTGNVPPWGQ